MRACVMLVTLALALARPAVTWAQAAEPWTALLSITFPIFAELPGLPLICTGWYAAPRGRAGSKHVSVYVTAGHCAVPHVVRIPEGREPLALIARVNRLGLDAAVGVRIDPRAGRAFLELAATPPSSGDLALVVGYSGGHLTEAVLTTVSGCLNGFVCLHGDYALRPGMSGAPVLSLRTGRVLGLLVGTPPDSHGYGDPHRVWATSSTALRTLIELASPGALGTGDTDTESSPLFPWAWPWQECCR